MNWKLEIGDHDGNNIAADVTIKDISITHDNGNRYRYRTEFGDIAMTLECDASVMKGITDYYFADDRSPGNKGTLTIKPEHDSASFNVFNNAFLTFWQCYVNDNDEIEVSANWKFSGKETVLTLPEELRPEPWVEGIWPEPPEEPDVPDFWRSPPAYTGGEVKMKPKREKSQLDWRRFGF